MSRAGARAARPPAAAMPVPLWQGGSELRVGGRPLAARWLGPPPAEAPTLVLLHEGLGCIGMWKDFPERLAAATGLGVLAYTRFGYAGSAPCALPRPVSYMHAEAREVLPAVLAACGIEQAVLVGHSDGGSIALLYCGEQGGGVIAAITMGAHVLVEDRTVASIAEARDRYVHGDLKARLARYHGERVDEVFWGWNDIWLSPAFRDWNIEHCLAGITAPLLVIQGAGDPYGTPAQVERICAGCAGPALPLILDECSHWPHLEQGERSIAAIAGFLAELS